MIVGPASSSPSPPGAPSAPNWATARWTAMPSGRDRPRPYHSVGHVGADHPAVPMRSHHSATVSSGSQLSFSQALTSATASVTGGAEVSVISTVDPQLDRLVKYAHPARGPGACRPGTGS